MWKYRSTNDWDNISLHDCRFTHISEGENDITFELAEGYWIWDTNEQNPYKKILGTDKSRLTLTNAAFIKAEVEGQAMAWEDYCLKINSGEWKFECINENYNDQKCVYEGWVWFHGEPYHFDCRLEFTFQNAVYHWNKICENRTWQ